MDVADIPHHSVEVIGDSGLLEESPVNPVVDVGRVQHQPHLALCALGTDRQVDDIELLFIGQLLGLVQHPQRHVLHGFQSGVVVLTALQDTLEEDLATADQVLDFVPGCVKVLPVPANVHLLGELRDDGNIGRHHRITGEQDVVGALVGAVVHSRSHCK